MAGNSRRPGARRKPGTKKGPTGGSGGQRRKGLEGKGPTPPADKRPNHKAFKKSSSGGSGAGAAGGGNTGRSPGGQGGPGGAAGRRGGSRPSGDGPQTVVGRNPVVESLRAHIPATALHVAQGVDVDDRVRESLRTAGDRGIPVLEVPRGDLERMAEGAVHQGIALTVPAFEYHHPDDLLESARQTGHLARAEPLMVALDGVTDPRNLGAVLRSAAAFGAHAVLLPLRRSVGVTPVAWRTSAGAAARLPVGRATNLRRALDAWADQGLTVLGLDGDATVDLDHLDDAVPDAATGPLVIVVGSEGKGLSRLVRETCQATVSIPIAGGVESLNASVAAGVALAEVARRRRLAS